MPAFDVLNPFRLIRIRIIQYTFIRHDPLVWHGSLTSYLGGAHRILQFVALFKINQVRLSALKLSGGFLNFCLSYLGDCEAWGGA
jgi:hypothetical protein